jgi:hypothetical protein
VFLAFSVRFNTGQAIYNSKTSRLHAYNPENQLQKRHMRELKLIYFWWQLIILTTFN